MSVRRSFGEFLENVPDVFGAVDKRHGERFQSLTLAT